MLVKITEKSSPQMALFIDSLWSPLPLSMPLSVVTFHAFALQILRRGGCFVDVSLMFTFGTLKCK